MEARSVRRSAHRSVPVAVADGRGSAPMTPPVHTPSIRARFSRFGRTSMALLVAAALAVSTFGYIASASERTSVALGAGKWWLRVRTQMPLAGKVAPAAAPTTVTINGDVLMGQVPTLALTLALTPSLTPDPKPDPQTVTLALTLTRDVRPADVAGLVHVRRSRLVARDKVRLRPVHVGAQQHAHDRPRRPPPSGRAPCALPELPPVGRLALGLCALRGG
jgi:hypothetical protein